jgi:hypothetical protein
MGLKGVEECLHIQGPGEAVGTAVEQMEAPDATLLRRTHENGRIEHVNRA